MRNTKPVLMPSDPSEPEKTEPPEESTGTAGVLPELLPRTPTNSEENTLESQIEAFIAPPLPSSGERSRPQNLIDSSLYELHDLLKSVGTDKTSVRTTQVEIVKTKVAVAKELREMMRLKLDVYRTARGD